MTSPSGRCGRTSATQRSASGRIAGPLSPPGRPSGSPAGQRVADHDGGGPGVDDGPGALHDPHQVGAQLGQHRQAAGSSRCTAATAPPAWNGSRTSKTPLPSAAGADRFTSTAATPGARPIRRASSAYSPSDRPADATNDARAVLDQPGQLVRRGTRRCPGSGGRRRSPARWASPRSAAARAPCRGVVVIERVTNAAERGPGRRTPPARGRCRRTRRPPSPGSAPAVMRGLSSSQRTRSPRNTGPS